MRTSAGPLCTLSLLAVMALPAPAAAQQRQRQQQREQPCCRIEGQVVGPDGDQYGPVAGLRVALKRGKEPLKNGLTDKTGRYSIRFKRGDAINVKYGDEDKWEPAVVENISGRNDHRITKVLVLRHAGRLTRDQAGTVVSALEYMNNHPADFADELNKYTLTLNKNEFPPEFHERLSLIEQEVAARRKEEQPAPAVNPLFLNRPNRNISFEESASGGARQLWLDAAIHRFGSFFLLPSIEQLQLPAEAWRINRPPFFPVQPAPDARAQWDEAQFRHFRFQGTFTGLRGSYDISLAEVSKLIPDQPHDFLGGGVRQNDLCFITASWPDVINLGHPIRQIPRVNSLRPMFTAFNSLGSVDNDFIVADPGLQYRAGVLFGDSFDRYSFIRVFGHADVASLNTNVQFFPSSYRFSIPLTFPVTAPAVPPALRVLGANLFGVVPGKEYPLEITGPSIDRDSVLSAPASVEGISVLLNNPDPAAHSLRATVAVAEEVEPGEYKLLVTTGIVQYSLPFHIYQAPPEVSGEVGYPGATDDPPAASAETPQAIQVVIRGKHLRGAKVEPAGEAVKWLEVEGEPTASPDGTTLALKVLVREQTPAALYLLRVSNNNPEQKTQDVEFRVGPRP
jgi:hypothetical protein